MVYLQLAALPAPGLCVCPLLACHLWCLMLSLSCKCKLFLLGLAHGAGLADGFWLVWVGSMFSSISDGFLPASMRPPHATPSPALQQDGEMMGKGACSTSFVQASSGSYVRFTWLCFPGAELERSDSSLKKSSQIVVQSSDLELKFSWASPSAST